MSNPVLIPIQPNISEVTEIAELSKYGTFDYAVPHDWRLQNPNIKAVWFYNDRSRIFGRPLPYLAILRLARRKCKDPYDLLGIEASIATYKPHTLTAQNLITLLNS